MACVITLTLAVAANLKDQINENDLTLEQNNIIMDIIPRMKLVNQIKKRYKVKFINKLMNKLKDHHANSSKYR